MTKDRIEQLLRGLRYRLFLAAARGDHIECHQSVDALDSERGCFSDSNDWDVGGRFRFTLETVPIPPVKPARRCHCAEDIAHRRDEEGERWS